MTADEALDSYLAAVLAGSRRDAMSVIDLARAAGLDLRTLYLEVFQPALREIGQLWQENRVTVADEHLATAITQSAMLRLYGSLELPGAVGRTLIAACVETERHEIGLRMLCDILELEGWNTLFLGATVPTESLARMVAERKPAAVALSVSLPPHLPRARTMIQAIREATPENPPVILLGGRPFLEQPELAYALGADLTARDAAEGAALLRKRLS